MTLASTSKTTSTQRKQGNSPVPTTFARRIRADGVNIFYRSGSLRSSRKTAMCTSQARPRLGADSGLLEGSFVLEPRSPARHLRPGSHSIPVHRRRSLSRHDSALMARPGNADIQLNLFKDYADNVKLYGMFQQYLRT